MDHAVSPIAWNFTVLKLNWSPFLKNTFLFFIEKLHAFFLPQVLFNPPHVTPRACYQPIYWRPHILELKMWLELETGLCRCWFKKWILVKAKLISPVSWDFWCLWPHNNNRAGAHRERSRYNNIWEARVFASQMPGEGLQREVTAP